MPLARRASLASKVANSVARMEELMCNESAKSSPADDHFQCLGSPRWILHRNVLDRKESRKRRNYCFARKTIQTSKNPFGFQQNGRRHEDFLAAYQSCGARRLRSIVSREKPHEDVTIDRYHGAFSTLLKRLRASVELSWDDLYISDIQTRPRPCGAESFSGALEVRRLTSPRRPATDPASNHVPHAQLSEAQFGLSMKVSLFPLS